MPLTISPRQLSQRSQFYHQLSQLTAAGIPMINALDMISRNPPARSFRPPIERMVVRLKQGASISEAMEHLGDWVPAFDLALVKAAEHSGRLDIVFKLLAADYDDRARLLRQMISDLAYPVFVLHFALIMFPVINWFKGSSSVAFLGFEIICILAPFYIILGFIIYAVQGKRGPAWQAFLEKISKPIPVLGAARKSIALARLSIALESLLSAGVTIIEAWEMAAAACGSPSIHRTVLAWKNQLSYDGRKPSEVVNDASAQFPEVFRNLYHSGEVSGQLDESLGRLHTYYKEEGTLKLHLLAVWVPRLIYFCVAGYVAYKVISFYVGYIADVNKAGGL
jgi:type II secretory pathway component PulF